MKKFKKIAAFILVWFQILYINNVFAEPELECNWLPGCDKESEWVLDFVWNLVSELIKYVAVVAVFSLIIAGFMYIFSAWDDTKAKNARKWIFWSLVAVFISITWYLIINLINEAKITF